MCSRPPTATRSASTPMRTRRTSARRSRRCSTSTSSRSGRSASSPSPSGAGSRAGRRARGRRRSCSCATARTFRSSTAWRPWTRSRHAMAIRKPKPTSPGRRFVSYPDFAEITKSEPEKTLVEGLKKSGGRNAHGRKTSRHRGGGAKRAYRRVDFKRRKDGVDAKVAAIEYDPNRSAYIALLHYVDGEKRYILAPQGLKVGDRIQTSDEPPFAVGCCMKLKFMPLGSTICNIELIPGKGGKMVRSAGLSAQLMARSGGYATLRMPSGEVRLINEECRATFGAVSNPEFNLRVEGKAGRMRW